MNRFDNHRSKGRGSTQLVTGLLLAILVAVLALLIGSAVGVLSSLIVALVLGVLVSNTMVFPVAQAGMLVASSQLLRLGVALIGRPD